MPPETLRVIDGAAAGAWIKPRLRDGFGAMVKQQIPAGYGAHIRIFHPARGAGGNLVTWSEVARRLGRTAHGEMQWHAIVGSSDSSGMTGSEWPGGNPETGELELGQLKALCAILRQHTGEAAQCLFGLSTIYSGVEEALATKPLLRLPARDFAILAGPLSAVGELGFIAPRSSFTRFTSWSGDGPPPEREPAERFQHQSPNLIWPADRTWFVASEYDLDSTLVGGSSDLIKAIAAAPQLETWIVDPDDSLADDADKINLPTPHND